MADKPKPDEKDERLAIPLDPEEALRALLQVEPEDDSQGKDRGVARDRAER